MLCILFLGLPFTGLASAPSEKDWSALANDIDALRKSKKIPGLAATIVADGKQQWAAGYGFADNNREVPITPDTPFWIASITKTFVGLAYLHLEKNEKLDFDELAADTPNFTGLCDWLSGTTIPFANGLNCKAPITIRHILHHQVNDKPGTQFMYNPIMYSRLSRHLEHKFGEGVTRVEGRHNFLGQTIDRYILEPANMTRTVSSMWDRSKMDVFFDLADGFKVDNKGNKQKMRRPDKHIAGGAGVVSTVNDMAKYDIAISTGKVVSGTVRAKLLKPATFNNGQLSPYGYGWYFQCYKGQKLMWHSGWDPEAGYSSLHLRLLDQNIAFIVLANGEGVWWKNPLNMAGVERSDFALLFLNHVLGEKLAEKSSSECFAN